jgi:TRAP-type C4-dicarboxylate transport system substrate-binding protein
VVPEGRDIFSISLSQDRTIEQKERFMKKAFGLTILIVGLALAIALASSSPASAAKKVIKLSHSHQADFASEIHTAAWIFQKWVEDNSDTLEVKIYAANALGEERAVYEGMQLGSGASAVIKIGRASCRKECKA